MQIWLPSNVVHSRQLVIAQRQLAPPVVKAWVGEVQLLHTSAELRPSHNTQLAMELQ